MYHTGDMIIYSGHGVCEVLELCCPAFDGINKDKLYYKLSPVYETGFIYIPVDTTVFMRPVISKKEAENLIRRLPEIKEAISPRNLNAAYLKNYYDSFLKTHDCESFFKLIKGIYLKSNGMQKAGQMDRIYMKKLEDLLYGELAVALGIPSDEVVSYIDTTVRSVEKQCN